MPSTLYRCGPSAQTTSSSAPFQMTCSGPTSAMVERVELAHPDLGLVVPLGLAGQPGAVHPDPAVVVEEDRRVDAVGVEPDRVGPGPGRVGGRHQEVAAARPGPAGRPGCRPARTCRRGAGAWVRTARRRTRCRRSRAGRRGRRRARAAPSARSLLRNTGKPGEVLEGRGDQVVESPTRQMRRVRVAARQYRVGDQAHDATTLTSTVAGRSS